MNGEVRRGRLSIVVPTRNSARTLERCLDSATAQTHDDVEVVVVDNRSSDRTLAIAHARAHRVERGGPERSAQRNRGWRSSTGEYVLFLDSDQVLEPEVAAEAVAAFESDPAISGLVVPELSRGEGFLAECRSLEKRLYVGDSRVEAARVFRRSVLQECGGYDESLTGAEDYELPDRLEAHGHRLGRIAARVWHDEGRVGLLSTFRKKRRYGRGVAGYVGRPGSAERLRRGPSPGRAHLLAEAPRHAGGLLALKLIDAGGLLLGIRDARRAGVAGVSASGAAVLPPPPAVPPAARVLPPVEPPALPPVEPPEPPEPPTAELPAVPAPASPPSRRRRVAGRLVAYGIPVLATLGAVGAWYRPGAFVAGGDVSPFLRGNLAQELLSLWGHQLSGAGSTSYEIARAPEAVLFRLAGLLGLSPAIGQLVLFGVCFAAAALGAAYLAGALVRRPAAIAAAGLVGAFNPFTLTTLPNPLPLLAGGLAGVLAGMVWRRAQGRPVSPLALAAVTLAASYLALNPPLLALVAVIVVLAVALARPVGGPGATRRAGRLVLRAAPWALLLNLWWLLPLALVTLRGPAGVAITAQTDVASWSWSQVRASLLNVASLNAHWGWTHPEYFPYAGAMGQAPWMVLRWLLPAGVAAGALLARPGRRAAAAVLVAVAAVTIFLAKGLHAPLATVNSWLYDAVPGMWLLRDPMSKLGVLLVLVYGALLALGIERILAALAGRSRRLRVAGGVVLLAAVGAMVAYPWPLWTGAVVPDSRAPLPGEHVHVPAGWTAAANAVNRSPLRGKALVLPLATYYQVTTTWGYHGVAEVPQQLLRRPVVDRLPGGYFGNTAGFDALLDETQDAIAAGHGGAALGALRALGVSHVLVRHDVLATSQGTGYADDGRLSAALTRMPGVRPVLRSRLVDVFAVHGAQGVVQAAGRLSSLRTLDPATQAAAVAALEPAGAGTSTAVPVDGFYLQLSGPHAAVPFDLAGGGSYRLDRRANGAALLRARLTAPGPRRTLTLSDATAVNLDGRGDPAARPLSLRVPGSAPLTIGSGGRLRPLTDGALVTGAGTLTVYTQVRPQPLSRFSGLEDCNRQDARGFRAAGLSLAHLGAGAVRLSATAHAACTWVRIAAGRPAAAYRIELRYRRLRGAPPRLCVWEDGPNRCVVLPAPVGDRGTFAATFAPAPRTRGVRLYLYADGGVPGGTSIDYGAIAAAPLQPVGRLALGSAPAQGRALPSGPHVLRLDQPATSAALGPLSRLEDCGASDARTPAQAGLALLRRPGGVVELRARAHIACAWVALRHLDSAGLVRVGVGYRDVTGAPARLCVWEVGPERCAELPTLAPSTNWRRFSAELQPDPGTVSLRLYLYADGQQAPPTRVQYRDLELRPVEPTTVVLAGAGSATVPRLTWRQTGTAAYDVGVHGARGEFTLVLDESYANGWSLRGLPAGWRAQHLMVNGYANGWRIVGRGSADLTLTYGPDVWERIALLVSLAAAAAMVLLAAARLVRRRWRRARGR